MSQEGENRSIYIHGSNVDSPNLSGNFSGSVNLSYSSNNNTIVSTSSNNNITIDKDYLDKIHPDYSASLQQLIDTLNKRIEEEKLPQQKVTPLKETANDVAKELVDVKPGAPVRFEKRNELNSKLARFAKAIAKSSPMIARTVIGMTPLSPLAEVIGEGFEKVVQEYLEEPQEEEKSREAEGVR